jgi:guanosine-3',5'-bis(diphosphate) 3'-pyrophosphohydrolase
MESLEQTYRPLLEAVSFAARAHHGQIRKDGKTPYASHVFRVCLIVRHVFGLDEPAMLTAALLHDTIEDTTTDFDDIERKYGGDVARWVAYLSKDKRLQDDEREEKYRAGLAAAPWQVKACKLADIFDNLLDSRHLSAEQRRRTVNRSKLYLAALEEPDLPAAVRNAQQLVTRLLADIEATLA